MFFSLWFSALGMAIMNEYRWLLSDRISDETEKSDILFTECVVLLISLEIKSLK